MLYYIWSFSGDKVREQTIIPPVILTLLCSADWTGSGVPAVTQIHWHKDIQEILITHQDHWYCHFNVLLPI